MSLNYLTIILPPTKKALQEEFSGMVGLPPLVYKCESYFIKENRYQASRSIAEVLGYATPLLPCLQKKGRAGKVFQWSNEHLKKLVHTGYNLSCRVLLQQTSYFPGPVSFLLPNGKIIVQTKPFFGGGTVPREFSVFNNVTDLKAYLLYAHDTAVVTKRISKYEGYVCCVH